MYLSYFGLREYPFGLTSDPRFFYTTIPYQTAYSGVYAAIRERKGFILLTGEPGTGKTTLLRRLSLALEDTVHIISLPLAAPTLEEVLSYLCQQLSLPVKADDWALKLAALREHLYALAQRGENAAVLIDEAQNLSKDTLDRLRALFSLEGPSGKLLQLVLAGQPELDEKLSQPELHHIRQRVAVHQQLLPLPKREVGAYIQHRLQIAGCSQQDLFDPEAIHQVIRYSRAIPRLINVICDNALFSTYRLGFHAVSAETITQVAQDLLLPPTEEDGAENAIHVPVVIPTVGKSAAVSSGSGVALSPFRHTTDIRFFYPNVVYEEAYRALLGAIRERKGLVLLTGEAGTGKTSLFRLLSDSTDETTHFTVIPSAPRTFEDLLSAICHRLAIFVRNDEVAAKLQALEEFLSSMIFRTEILVIDDAHRLSRNALEQLPLLLAMQDLNRNLLQILLVGQPQLETTLAHPALRFLQEHIAVYCRLTPLASEEVEPFIHHRLRTAGWGQREIFSQGAIEKIAQYSLAIPRRINNLCELALRTATAARQRTVSAELIDTLAANPHLSVILDTGSSPPTQERKFPTLDPRHFAFDRPSWQPLSSFRRKFKRLRKGIFLLAIGILASLLLFRQYAASWLGSSPSPQTSNHQSLHPSLPQQPHPIPNSRKSVSAPQRTKPRTQASTKPRQSAAPSTATKAPPRPPDLSTVPLANQGEAFHPLAENSPSITR
jgi:general secretion pathway protein A